MISYANGLDTIVDGKETFKRTIPRDFGGIHVTELVVVVCTDYVKRMYFTSVHRTYVPMH